ncbi:MAG: ATP-binding protein [Pseudomonadota bacterium]
MHQHPRGQSMFGSLNSSLLIRAGLAMGVITVLAIAGMASAIYVARHTHGEAGAVNLAGSLRMQSYRIAATIETDTRLNLDLTEEVNALTLEFEQRLNNPALAAVISTTNRRSLQLVYLQIKQRWRHSMLPRIQAYLQQIVSPVPDTDLQEASSNFHKLVASFVDDIDRMVRLLEEDAESSIHMLGLMQGISLMLTLLVAVITLYLLYTDVLSPLHDLLNSAERAGQGDFSVRVGHTGSDELGRLGQAFNTMAADLSTMYVALEARVMEKTEALTRRNRSLELLYKASQRLTETPVSDTTYHELLDEISGVLGSEAITLCLTDENKQRAYAVACIGPTPPMCRDERCDICLGDGRTRVLCSSEHGGSDDILSLAVKDEENDYGVLLVAHRQGEAFQAWQTQVLETLGKHIGISIGVARRVTQRRRLALLDERSVIARELHDSLAQSLSYLKIQVTRLYLLRKMNADAHQMDEVMSELKEGLDEAYRQLRELLTTFRLQMDGRGLFVALTETVAEFNTRGKVDILLKNQLKGTALSVNEEIHLLQIAREALSNVLHHSSATQAELNIQSLDDDGILLSVEDNGIGIPSKAERTNHYGLAIMHERAKSLNAELTISNRTEGGTRVRLRFKPNGITINQPILQEQVVS